MSAVEGLIRACVDDERMLVCASRFVDAVRARALETLARERVRFIDALRISGRTLHHAPRARGSVGGALRVLLLEARVLTAGRNAGDALSACRHSQDRLERDFTVALERQWSSELLGVIVEQLRDIQSARARLIGVQYAM